MGGGKNKKKKGSGGGGGGGGGQKSGGAGGGKKQKAAEPEPSPTPEFDPMNPPEADEDEVDDDEDGGVDEASEKLEGLEVGGSHVSNDVSEQPSTSSVNTPGIYTMTQVVVALYMCYKLFHQ